jgi:hypothetical protein
VIIDDPETRDSARSGVQTDLRARTIEADQAGHFEQEATEETEKEDFSCPACSPESLEIGSGKNQP